MKFFAEIAKQKVKASYNYDKSIGKPILEIT